MSASMHTLLAAPEGSTRGTNTAIVKHRLQNPRAGPVEYQGVLQKQMPLPGSSPANDDGDLVLQPHWQQPLHDVDWPRGDLPSRPPKTG